VAIESSFPGIGFNSYFGGSRKMLANGYAGYVGLNPVNGDLIFANSSLVGTAGNDNPVFNRMIINNDGNVGIGTNTPIEAGLVVNSLAGRTNATFGANRQGVSIFSTNPGIGFNISDNGTGYRLLQNGFGGLLEMNGTSGALTYLVRGAAGAAGASANLNTTALTILPNGNVGIGIGQPAARLHVQGSFQLQNGNQGQGRVLVSDAVGTATWSGPVAWVGIVPSQLAVFDGAIGLAGSSTLYGGVAFAGNDANSGTVVVPVDGLYQINVHMKPYMTKDRNYWALLQTKLGAAAWVERGGGTYRQRDFNANEFPFENKNNDVSYSVLLPLVAGQQVRVVSQFTDIGQPTLLGNDSNPASSSYFSGFLVR
jgi:hypothetical protein